MKTDILVVGGGLAGLAAAIWLRRKGHQVCLLERANQLGGRGRTVQYHGASFNVGPHALYCGRATELLADLGWVPQGGYPPATGAGTLIGGKVRAMPVGPVSLLSSGLFSLADRLEFAGAAMNFHRPVPPETWDWTVREYLDRTYRHEVVRRLVAALIRLTSYVHAPEHYSAGAALTQLQLGTRKNGVMYLDGGWQQLVDGLKSMALAEGVDVRLGCRAGEVITDRDGARGVRVGDQLFESKAVILALAGPTQVSALVDEGRHPELSTACQSAIAARAASLDLLLRDLPRPKSRFVLGLDQPLYFSLHSDVAKVAPPGACVFHCAKYLTPGEGSVGALEQMEAGMDAVQPGWRERVIERRFLPELAVCAAIPLASKGGFVGRPSVEVADRPGLYIAGDWIGSQGMLLDAALSSARDATERCHLRLGSIGPRRAALPARMVL